MTDFSDITNDPSIQAEFGAGIDENQLETILLDTKKVTDEQVNQVFAVLEERIAEAKTRENLLLILRFAGRTVRRLAAGGIV